MRWTSTKEVSTSARLFQRLFAPIATTTSTAAGCDLSPILAARAAAGVAPCLFAPCDGAQAARVMPTCRLARGQSAVEAALSLVSATGHALSADGRYDLCLHVMPSPWFGARVPGGQPGPDDDLVEGGVLRALRKFEAALLSPKVVAEG